MAFLLIDGIEVEVLADGGAAEREPIRIGESTRAFAGNLRSSVRAEKRSFVFPVLPQPPADLASLRAAIALGRHVSIAGDAIVTPIMGEVRMTEAPYVDDGDDGFLVACTLDIVEV